MVFRSWDLLDLVEKEVAVSKDEAVEKDKRKRDVKALCLIQ